MRARNHIIIALLSVLPIALQANPVEAGYESAFQTRSPVPGWRAIDTGSGYSFASLSMPVVLPLELQIGKYIIQKETGTAPIMGQTMFQSSTPVLQRGSAVVDLDKNGSLQLNVRESVYRPGTSMQSNQVNPHRAWLGAQPFQYQQALTLAYRWNHTNVLFDVGRSRQLRDEVDNRTGPERINAGLALGVELSNFQQSFPVQVLFGVGSRHSVVDPFREAQVVGAEFGTVYLTPGFQIQARSVIIETVFEVPFHSYDLRNESGSIDDRGFSEMQDIRARFGMKYYLD